MFEYLLRELFILHIAKRFRLPEFFKTFRITFLHAGRKQPSAPPMYAGNPKKQCFPHQDRKCVCVFYFGRKYLSASETSGKRGAFGLCTRKPYRKRICYVRSKTARTFRKKLHWPCEAFVVRFELVSATERLSEPRCGEFSRMADNKRSNRTENAGGQKIFFLKVLAFWFMLLSFCFRIPLHSLKHP